MKKVLCMLLVVVLCSSLNTVIAEEANVTEYRYSVNDDNTLTIKGIAKQSDNEENLIIPAVIDGTEVKTIASRVISSSGIETIHISEGIEIIEDNAVFVCFNLKELYIPSTVKSMGSIMGCNKLEKIVVDENNPYFVIGEDGWLYNKDKTELYWCPPSVKGTVVIPDGVKIIKKNAFWHCWELEKVVIGKGVEKIEEEAFANLGDSEVIFYNPNTEIIPAFSEYNTHSIGWNRTQVGSFGKIKTVYGYIGSTAEEVFTKKSNVPSDPEDYRAYRTYPEVEFRHIIDIKINGETMEFDTVAYIKNDRTMVPMRAIFEALGAEVSWDNETRTAIGVKDNIEVKIAIGENVLYKNGEAIELDSVAEITNDRTMVPVRAISEAFSYIVEWDNETKIVNILDPYKRKYYTYDEKGQVVSISSNLWSTDVVRYSYLYDESGRVVRVWERPMIKNSDRLFEYTYNEEGQIIAKGTCKDWWMDALRGAPIDKAVSFTEVEKYFYNDEGQLTYAEYPTGGRRYYVYEEGKLIREENDKGKVLKKYVYDENGRINYTESY